MHEAYFEVRFRTEVAPEAWPETFAVITAYETTGETWSDERNSDADRELREHLGSLSSFVHRLTGYSPTTGHAEPGWAVAVDLETALAVGNSFRQDAIYFIFRGELFVTHCDDRSGLVPVDSFLKRLDP